MLTKQEFLNLVNERDTNKAARTIKEFLEYHDMECNYFISSDSVYDFVLGDLKTYGWQSVWTTLSCLLYTSDAADEEFAV